MNNTFDGKSFRRSPNRNGEKTPVVGVRRERAVFTASGGETSINLSQLNPPIQNIPGQNILTVKRTSVPVMISGTHFFESGINTVNFSTALVSGEKVEFIKEVTVTSVMALAPKPDITTFIATAGQTKFSADFFWPYNQQPTKTRGAVRVEVNGVAKERGIDYTELAPLAGSSQSHQIEFINPMNGGERITLQPTNQIVDNAISNSATHASEISSLKSRVDGLETLSSQVASMAPNFISYRDEFSQHSTSATIPTPISGLSLSLNTKGRPIGILLNIKCSVSNDSGRYKIMAHLTGPSGFSKWFYLVNDNGFTSNKQRSFSLTEICNDAMSEGSYNVTIHWESDATNTPGSTITQKDGMSFVVWEEN